MTAAPPFPPPEALALAISIRCNSVGFKEFDYSDETAAAVLARFSAEAVAREREAIRLAVLEQRCERGTPWDTAIMAIERLIRARGDAVRPAELPRKG